MAQEHLYCHWLKRIKYTYIILFVILGSHLLWIWFGNTHTLHSCARDLVPRMVFLEGGATFKRERYKEPIASTVVKLLDGKSISWMIFMRARVRACCQWALKLSKLVWDAMFSLKFLLSTTAMKTGSQYGLHQSLPNAILNFCLRCFQLTKPLLHKVSMSNYILQN